MEKTVLIIEDEEPIRRLVAAYLEREGFRVFQAADGLAGWQLFEAERPLVVVLDLMLPGIDGLELCRRIRATSSDPYVIMLTARVEEMDRVVGLEVGADDYVTKPFSPRELVARVRAAMRRLRPPLPPASTEDHQPALRASHGWQGHAGLVLDKDGRRVFVDGEERLLTALEFGLLETFSRHPGIALTREQLIRQVWGYDFPGEARLVDVHVAQLRKKLGPRGRHWICTVRGVGYRFDVEEPVS